MVAQRNRDSNGTTRDSIEPWVSRSGWLLKAAFAWGVSVAVLPLCVVLVCPILFELEGPCRAQGVLTNWDKQTSASQTSLGTNASQTSQTSLGTNASQTSGEYCGNTFQYCKVRRALNSASLHRPFLASEGRETCEIFWFTGRKRTPTHRMPHRNTQVPAQQMPDLLDCEEHHANPNEQWVEAH